MPFGVAKRQNSNRFAIGNTHPQSPDGDSSLTAREPFECQHKSFTFIKMVKLVFRQTETSRWDVFRESVEETSSDEHAA